MAQVKCYYCGQLHHWEDECGMELAAKNAALENDAARLTPAERRLMLWRGIFTEDQEMCLPCANCGVNPREVDPDSGVGDAYCSECIDGGKV